MTENVCIDPRCDDHAIPRHPVALSEDALALQPCCR